MILYNNVDIIYYIPVYMLYIYIYMYNIHLGLIHPPLWCCFPQATFFTIHVLSTKPEYILNSGQDCITLTGDTSCSSWGSSWGSSLFSQNETPQKVFSCTYTLLIKCNTFWAPETRSTFGHPQDHPQDDSKLYVCCLFIDISWYLLFFAFINFRGPRDFINGWGLLIQGGDYIRNVYIHIIIYIYICIYIHVYV